VISVRPVTGRDALLLRIPAACAGQAQELAMRARRLFDLDADPARIAAQLRHDSLLRPLLKRRPGLRVPGAWDRFELAVRAVLGQQVSVAGATTLCGRLVRAAGETSCGDETGSAGDTATTEGAGGLCRLFPSPARLAKTDLQGLGLTGARAATISALARAVLATPDLLEPVRDHDEIRRRLVALPGIGDWTAQYVSLRALGDPDAFPAGDLGLRRALAADRKLNASDKLPAIAAVATRAAGWRPWRAYAVMHLWLADPS
jgi:3-methyladenine DNA glycosylase/8-oxoguanine DNA glycosylase